MSITLDIDALRQRFVSQWPSKAPGVQALHDNQPAVETADEWVRVVVRPGASRRIALGSGNVRVEQLGRVIVQVFVRPETGSARAYALAEAASSIYRMWRADAALRCLEPDIQTIPAAPGDDYMQVNVSVPYVSIRTYATQ